MSIDTPANAGREWTAACAELRNAKTLQAVDDARTRKAAAEIACVRACVEAAEKKDPHK